MTTDQQVLWFSLGSAILALLTGGIFIWLVLRRHAGSPEMQKVAKAIQEGAGAYLIRQYTVVAVVATILFLIIGFTGQLGWNTAWGFLIGAVCSALAGIIGMNVA